MFSLIILVLMAVLTLQSLPAQAAVTPVVSDLSAPVRLTAPVGDSRLFVVERTGRIRVFTGNGEPLGVFLDLSDQVSLGGERGLLGLAFPPDHQSTRRFYVNYTDVLGRTRVDRFLVDPDDADRALPDSQEPLLHIDQPQSNHNGGDLAFGPDGMLYVGMGDGGTSDTAQNNLTLLGKMLRLDVSRATGYAIPADNPYLQSETRDEVWAKGLRNPWCYSFDRLTGDLYIADVGQNLYEEIDVLSPALPPGQNLGWPLMEGSECYSPPSDCNDGSLILPVHTYQHGGDPYRCSISGGHVYRGDSIPSLQGRYLFSDYCSNQIWALRWTAQQGVTQVKDLTAEMTPAGGYQSVVSLGQDGKGELYVVDMPGGTVYRIVSTTSQVPDAPALHLNQNVPNPFNPSTRIDFALATAGHATLEVLDLAGRRLAVLVDGPRHAGAHHVTWDGTDDRGARQAAGVYLYRLTAPGQVLTRKMALIE